MADFRKKLFGLASAATIFSGMAFGQNYCTGTTPTLNPVTGASFIRQEGQTELLPQMTFSCQAGAGGFIAATANLTIYLSPAVTITSASIGSGKVEASAVAGNTVTGTVVGSAVTFTGIAIPATAPGVTTSITISNIRVNASSLPAAPAGSLPQPISAQGFISGTGVTPGPSGAPNVAYAFSGFGAKTGSVFAGTDATLGTSLASAGLTTFGVCGSINTGGKGSATPWFYVGIAEGFQNAFKTVAEEAGNGASAVAANSGTRIKLTFANVPAGLGLFVPQTIGGSTTFGGAVIAPTSPVTTTNPTILLVASETAATGAANLTTITTTPSSINTLGLVQLTVSGGTATAVYEIVGDNQGAVDYFSVPVYLQAATNTVTTGPALTVTTGLAPQPATAASLIPSFSSTAPSIVTSSTVAFSACSTNLLFPFVTNANGFETGIAISNTSKDPFGTKTQSGICTLNFYQSGVSGATNPTAVTAPNLAEGTNQPFLAGETYAFTLTQALGVNTANPATFQGYMIAACNFNYGHGFGYILGGLQPGAFVNPTNTAMGYLAIVLNRAGTTGALSDSFGN